MLRLKIHTFFYNIVGSVPILRSLPVLQIFGCAWSATSAAPKTIPNVYTSYIGAFEGGNRRYKAETAMPMICRRFKYVVIDMEDIDRREQ